VSSSGGIATRDQCGQEFRRERRFSGVARDRLKIAKSEIQTYKIAFVWRAAERAKLETRSQDQRLIVSIVTDAGVHERARRLSELRPLLQSS
jgi:hypothetical protein